jgi:ribosome biogenesis protein ENP2
MSAIVNRASDGGVEMSWTPSAASSRQHAYEDAQEERRGSTKGKLKSKETSKEKRKGVETFGAGMEKGGEDGRDLSESDRRGRTERRRGIRSGSKNAIFGRT